MHNTRYVLAEALKAEGYEVFEAMDGLEVLNCIRSNDDIKDIPIFLSTGKINKVTDLLNEKNKSVQAILNKPYKTAELVAKIKDYFKD